MLALDALPSHLVIIGGSYIGLEFAQMYRRFGSEVTVVEMKPRLVPREDPDVSDAIKEILESEGIHIRLEADASLWPQVVESDRHGPCQLHRWRARGIGHARSAGRRRRPIHRRPRPRQGWRRGRRPRLYHRGRPVPHQHSRASGPPGGCNGRGAFTHTAYNDFEIVAANLLDNDPRRVSDRIEAYALYIDPPLGHIGMTETEVRKTGKPAPRWVCG